MEYQIEVDFIVGGFSATYFPNKTFHHIGDPREAYNYRINQILKNHECDLNKRNIIRTRTYTVNEKKKLEVLAVNFRK